MSTRFVVLGLARPRTPWFAEVGRWATSGSAPIEFIRCVSREELLANLASGRGFSAVLIDGDSPELDRDLLDDVRQAGAATIVVDDQVGGRDWPALGALAVLPARFGRMELVAALDSHATPFDRADGSVERIRAIPTGSRSIPDGMGLATRWVTVVGGGTGASVLAMALAQQLAAGHGDGDVVLADLALDADQAMLHAAPDIVPGLSELVELHRGTGAGHDAVRDLTFAVDGRGYQLLLGLRRHQDWAALRPRALDAALDGLTAAFRFVVADAGADVEGERECASIDVEERNALARQAARRADVVVVVGTGELVGTHGLIRTIDRLRRFGVDGARILPVINRAPRPMRARADLARAVGTLCAGSGGDGGPRGGSLAAPIFVPAQRRLDAILRDGGPLPDQLGRTLANAVRAMLERRVAVAATPEGPVAIRPGELGHRPDERAAS